MTQPRNTLSASRPPNRPRILDDYSHMFLDAEAGSMWTNLTAGFDITAHPAPLAGAHAPAQQAPLQAPVQVLTVNFTEAAHVQRLVKGMRRSGLIPVLVDNAQGQAPSQWHHDRSQ